MIGREWQVLVLTALVAVAGCATTPRDGASGGEREMVVRDARLVEISGLAASTRTAGLWWAHNDSGDGPLLYAFGDGGVLRGVVELTGVVAVDWEDMASFRLDGESWLAIGDVGDNRSWRTDTAIHLVREPAGAGLDATRTLRVEVAATMPVRFPDGPRDVESLAVDATDRSVWLISKRTTPAMLYRLPLEVERGRATDTPPATLVTPLDLPSPSPLQRLTPSPAGLYGSQPTGLDFAGDGLGAALLTYATVWWYARAPGESWGEALARRPVELGPTNLFQAEAVAVTPDGREVVFTTEGVRPPLRRFVVPRGENPEGAR